MRIQIGELSFPTKAPSRQPASSLGLSGYFGHTFVRDENGNKRVQYQFRILRRLLPGRWVVQMYSFWDGTPTQLRAYSEDFLLSDDAALYQTEEIWRGEYDKSEQRCRALGEQSKWRSKIP